MDGVTVALSSVLPVVPDIEWKVVRIGDFQGDGKADLFWRHSVSGNNAVWLMDGPNVALSAAVTSVLDVNWGIAGTP